MKSYRPKLCLTWFACALALFSPAPATAQSSAEGVAFFEKHIRPLFVSRCYKCHSSKADRRESGLLLDSRKGWSVGGENGPAVIPGNADASLLIQAVRYLDADLQMPPDKPLSKNAIATLVRWVRMGAPDPRDAASGNEYRENPSDPIAGREHWAFRPLSSQRQPIVEATDWPRSRIDSYILAGLEAASLAPAPDADAQVLLRRVYFQLIGLPPTPQQLAAFLDDKRPDAFPRLVDQLLSSPRFGERWGRHWLDLARYADSNGLDENFLFREAWRYRNWVIDAVNDDTPYDRFVLEQIAGDLLPHESIEQRDRQRIAAGFMVIGPKVLLGNDDNRQRMEIADEQLDTIGRAFLGQTLGCARCHDHKFDPVPTADYYAMAGILTSTQVMERRYMLGQQRVMERLVGLGSKGDGDDQSYEQYWLQRPQLKKQQQHAKSALELLEKNDAEAFAKIVDEQRDAVADGATDTSETTANRIKAQKSLVAKLDAAIASPPQIPPRAMIPCDVDAPHDEHIRLAGQFDRLGEKVSRGFLQVLNGAAVEIPEGQSGRIELSQWLTDTDAGAGQLAARVYANRVWHHLIGRGIVRTVDNCGRTGEAPSHPELLDHLAAELIESGWSTKDLVRKIVLSRTFSMSSQHDDPAYALDPENRLLWRSHRRRLEPEALRDAMMSIAAILDLAPMGSSVSYLGDQATAVGDNKVRRRTDFPCRSVYLPVIRNDLPELFEVFDFTDPHTTTGMRSQTMVAAQGLFILNDDSVMEAAEATARRLLSGEEATELGTQVDTAFEWILGTRATEGERAKLQAFVVEVEQQLRKDGDPQSRLRAWSTACHALFASSRFQILE
jgi:hypothetical protein